MIGVLVVTWLVLVVVAVRGWRRVCERWDREYPYV